MTEGNNAEERHEKALAPAKRVIEALSVGAEAIGVEVEKGHVACALAKFYYVRSIVDQARDEILEILGEEEGQKVITEVAAIVISDMWGDAITDARPGEEN